MRENLVFEKIERSKQSEKGNSFFRLFAQKLFQKRILAVVNFGIQPAFFEERLVRSRLDDMPVVDHENEVCVNIG